MFKKETLPRDPYLYNGLALAYMGDAIYETYVRQHVLSLGATKPHQLHRQATNYVSAKAQAKILEALLAKNMLVEREIEMIKRGRNAKSHTVPKHTDLKTYSLSTAFESLLGYLFLSRHIERLEELITMSFAIIEGDEEDDE